MIPTISETPSLAPPKKILITGANGMLAQAIKNEFKNNDLICTDTKELDITGEQAVKNYVAKLNPDLLINCAAYTAVDKAEENEDLAYKVNAEGPKNLALACAENDVALIHISTDYVFGGSKSATEEYSEDDEKHPESAYGRTKLAGENFIIENCKKYYIFRTAWLYGQGHNFVETMLNLAKDHEEVKVVNDQHGSPTYAVDLASIIHQAVEKNIPYGIYNATNLGNTTWYDFTKTIYAHENVNCEVIPVSSEEFKSLAKRPKNSQMSKAKLLSYGIKIPDYKDALDRYLKNRTTNERSENV